MCMGIGFVYGQWPCMNAGSGHVYGDWLWVWALAMSGQEHWHGQVFSCVFVVFQANTSLRPTAGIWMTWQRRCTSPCCGAWVARCGSLRRKCGVCGGGVLLFVIGCSSFATGVVRGAAGPVGGRPGSCSPAVRAEGGACHWGFVGGGVQAALQRNPLFVLFHTGAHLLISHWLTVGLRRGESMSVTAHRSQVALVVGPGRECARPLALKPYP